jgi:hypothetical protein
MKRFINNWMRGKIHEYSTDPSLTCVHYLIIEPETESAFLSVRFKGLGEVCTGFWWGNLGERDSWGDPGVDGRIILGWIFKKWDVGVRNGLGCPWTGICGGRL